MARTAGTITGKLSAAKVTGATKPGMLNDGAGLYLKIDEGGSKSWILRFKVHGRSRKFGLGPTHTIGLALAREKAADARRLLLDGIDPIEARKKAKAAAALQAARMITFDACAKACIEQNKAEWKNPKHATEWSELLKRHASPTFGKLAVADVDTTLIKRALDKIWLSKPVTAGRVRQRIETVLDYAKANGYRTGENPASLKGNLAHLLAKQTKNVKTVKHHAAMPHAELPTFVATLRDSDDIAAQAMLLTILSAGRTGEIIGAKWDEFDFDKKLWTVPAARMKGGIDHDVPLAPAAIKLLHKMREIGKQYDAPEFVFPNATERGQPMVEHGMRYFLHRLGRRDFTVHGMRSSFRDWCAERHFPDAVAEAALAHTIPDAVCEGLQADEV